MTINKLNNKIHKFNQRYHVSFITNDDQAREYLKRGYRFVMLKRPTRSQYNLNDDQKYCLNLLIKGYPIYSIGYFMGIHKSQVDDMLIDLRIKFACITNCGLVSRMYELGLNYELETMSY
jgi:hypothetical protein